MINKSRVRRDHKVVPLVISTFRLWSTYNVQRSCFIEPVKTKCAQVLKINRRGLLLWDKVIYLKYIQPRYGGWRRGRFSFMVWDPSYTQPLGIHVVCPPVSEYYLQPSIVILLMTRLRSKRYIIGFITSLV